MRIVYHLGAHCTDDERLIRCLLKNRAVLAEEGIAVPAPTRYRRLMRDTSVQLKGGFASDEQQALILDQIVGDSKANRVILSSDSFLSYPAYVVRGSLYPFAGDRIRAFTRIFPGLEAEFHLAIRNPATFLPALQKAVVASGNAKDILENADPMHLRWSDVVQQVLVQNPGVPLTVWCDEETPLIWPEVLQAVSGHGPATELADSDELLSLIMNDIGLARLKAYSAEHPPQGIAQRRRIVSAFLEKFARPDKVDFEIDMPGWDDGLVARMTERYMADVERIRRHAGVTFIST
jgi:hypothetical protein